MNGLVNSSMIIFSEGFGASPTRIFTGRRLAWSGPPMSVEINPGFVNMIASFANIDGFPLITGLNGRIRRIDSTVLIGIDPFPINFGHD